MKKGEPFGRWVYARSLMKIFVMIKMSFFLILFSAFQVQAKNANGQNLSMNLKNTEIKQVLNTIEKMANYRFLYDYDLQALKEKVDFKVENTPLDKALTMLFEGTGLTYKQASRKLYVILSKNKDTKDIPITGKVTNEAGIPLSGVSVVVKGTQTGTITNSEGVFNIDVPTNNAVLIISSVGYVEQAITVNGRQEVNIVLVAAQQVMEQVVVVGYGTQRKKDLTGAVDVIGLKELQDRPNTQFGYAIEGKAAGVHVVRPSGQPQSGFSIRVRGTSSITSNSDPLYIIDGVPTQGTSDINPADIESITILKDASSAAIYGSAGANGVVIVTTKRGKNQKLKIGLNASVTASSPWKKLSVLNADQFKELATDMGQTVDWSKYTANTNWQNETFRTAISQTYQLNASGGTKKTSYYASASILNQNGIVLTNNLKRATFKLNLDHQLTKWAKLGGTFSYANWKDVDVPENRRLGVVMRMLTEIPIIGIRDASNPLTYARSPFISDIENPVSIVNQPTHLYKSNRYQGNAFIELVPIKDLKLKSLFGFENNKGLYTSFQDSIQILAYSDRDTNSSRRRTT